jgi:hypothetical protein
MNRPGSCGIVTFEHFKTRVTTSERRKCSEDIYIVCISAALSLSQNAGFLNIQHEWSTCDGFRQAASPGRDYPQIEQNSEM